MATTPSRCPPTLPVAEIVAILGSDEVHVTPGFGTRLFDASSTTAISWTEVPVATMPGPSIVIDFTGSGAVGAIDLFGAVVSPPTQADIAMISATTI